MRVHDGTLPIADFAALTPEGRVSDYLALVAEMSRDFAASMDIQATVRLALRRITDYLGAEAGSVFMLTPGGDQLSCQACVGPVDISGLSLPVSQGIVGRSVRENRTLIVRDVKTHPDFAEEVDAATGFETLSILCAPLSVTDEVLGCIELINKQGGKLFDQRDQSVLEALAAAAAMALFNARQAAALVDQQRVARELELAQEIQRGLLPTQARPHEAIHGFNLPARLVSGDFYDYVTLGDGRMTFMLADVAGKGINAALLMAKAQSLFRLLAKNERSPSEIAALINDELCETATLGMFVTAVIGFYDPKDGSICAANAGHEPALILRADGARTVMEATAPPLGILPVEGDISAFPEAEVSIAGGALYMFTDGLTEGRVIDGSRFGRGRTDALIAAVHHLDLPRRLRQIAGPLLRRPAPLHDDITLMVVDDRFNAQQRGLPELDHGVFPGQPASLREIRQVMRHVLDDVGCEIELKQQLVLAVDEACQNIVRHGYGGGCDKRDIEFRVRGTSQQVEIELQDRAAFVDGNAICPRDLSDVRPGGLGVNLICSVMDDVEFHPRPDGGQGNLLVLKRHLDSR